MKLAGTICICFFLILGSGNLAAQEIQWTKTYDFGGWGGYGDKIVQLEDSSYAAIARIAKFGYQQVSIIYGLGLMKLDKNGDTIFVKKMWGSSSGNANSLAKTYDFSLLIGVGIFKDTVFNARMRILKCDYNGNMQWMYNYIGDEWLYASLNKVIPSRNGGCYAIGYGSSIFGVSTDMFLTRLDPNGQLDWTYRYSTNPDASNTAGYNIEEMPDGNYLLSGGSNDKMWTTVVDSDGVQLSEHVFAQMPGGLGLYDTEIKQGHEAKSYYGKGTTFNPRLNIINQFDSARNKTWQKVNNVLGGPLHIGRDGSFVRNEGYEGGSSFLTKYRVDSTKEWRINIGQAGNQIINNITYDGLGSAVLSGYKKDLSTGRDNVYFIKVSNVGYPVNPLSTKPKVETQKSKGPELVAYPNPAQQYFYLQGIKGKTKVALYNLQGAELGKYTIRPNDAIPVWKLQPGLYVWKAEDGKRVWSGKILKEAP